MEIKVILDGEKIKMPTKAHDADAGFDLFTPDRVVVKPHDSVVINTGVHMEIPVGFVGFLKSKSGLNMCGIRGEGVIDSGYTGQVVVKLFNDGEEYVILEEGQKCIQIVILPIPEVELVQVDRFEETERGDNGFGSSGKF